MTPGTKQVLDYLASAGPLANTVASNLDADAIMLQTGGTMLSRGILYDIVCQSLSPGTCRLTLHREDL